MRESEILCELLNRYNLVLEMPQEEDLVDYEICQDIESFTIVSHFPDIELHNRREERIKETYKVSSADH